MEARGTSQMYLVSGPRAAQEKVEELPKANFPISHWPPVGKAHSISLCSRRYSPVRKRVKRALSAMLGHSAHLSWSSPSLWKQVLKGGTPAVKAGARPRSPQMIEKIGGRDRDRTGDPLLAKQAG